MPKRKRGRPPVKTMPPPIPDTLENIAMACMQGPPKIEWDYVKPACPDQQKAESVSD